MSANTPTPKQQVEAFTQMTRSGLVGHAFELTTKLAIIGRTLGRREDETTEQAAERVAAEVERLDALVARGAVALAAEVVSHVDLMREVARLEALVARKSEAPTHSLECPQCGAAVFAREVATWYTDEEEPCAGCGSQCVVGLDEHPGRAEAFVYIRSTPTPAEDLDTLTEFFGEPDPERPWQHAGGDPFDAHALVARLRHALDRLEAEREKLERERNAWCYGARTGRWRLLVPHAPDYGDVNEHGESDRLYSDFRDALAHHEETGGEP